MTEARRADDPDYWQQTPADPVHGNPKQSRADWVRIRSAAALARWVYPGVVGELVARELTSYGELGWRLQPESLPERLIDDVLERPAPVTRAAKVEPVMTWPPQ